MPSRLAHQRKRAIRLYQRAPSNWNFRGTKELVRQNEETQISAAIAKQFFELRTAGEPTL